MSQKGINQKTMAFRALVLIFLISALPLSCLGQSGGGTYDFGGQTFGQKRGDWSPNEWLALVLLIMIIAAGLALSIGLCYYVSKRDTRITYSNPYIANI